MAKRSADNSDTGSRLGSWLRRRRNLQGLSLKDVASMSREVSPDSAGRVSHPYLSQIESGRVAVPRLPKLLTLAAIYQASIETVISQATEAGRARLRDELAAWKAEGRAIPNPVVASNHRCLSRRDREGELTAIIDDRLSNTAHNVAIPYSDQGWFKDVAREVVLRAAILPYLTERNVSSTTKAYWADRREFARDMHTQVVRRPLGWPWQPVADDFTNWILHELDEVSQLLGNVASWSLQADTELASVHFQPPHLEADFGFDLVPYEVVRDLRVLQLASLLHATHPHPDELPPPPRYSEAIRRYMVDVFLGRSRLRDDPDSQYPPLSAGFRAAADFIRSDPELVNGEGPDEAVQHSVLRFVSAAADQVHALFKSLNTRHQERL